MLVSCNTIITDIPFFTEFVIFIFLLFHSCNIINSHATFDYLHNEPIQNWRSHRISN